MNPSVPDEVELAATRVVGVVALSDDPVVDVLTDVLLVAVVLVVRVKLAVCRVGPICAYAVESIVATINKWSTRRIAAIATCL